MQWKIQAIFSQSLENQTLREMAKGKPVLYRPSTRKTPKDLLPFRNKYLGHVQDIRLNNEASVYCKDNQLRQIQAEDLFFEASPSVIREYERQLGIKYESESILSKMQELSFVLTPQGKRNSFVFKDRMQAIRHFLAGSSKEQLVIPLSCLRDGLISLALSPMRVEIEQGV